MEKNIQLARNSTTFKGGLKADFALYDERVGPPILIPQPNGTVFRVQQFTIKNPDGTFKPVPLVDNTVEVLQNTGISISVEVLNPEDQIDPYNVLEIRYRWYKNGSYLYEINNANGFKGSPEIVITEKNSLPEMSGVYTIEVSNNSGTTVSGDLILRVHDPINVPELYGNLIANSSGENGLDNWESDNGIKTEQFIVADNGSKGYFQGIGVSPWLKTPDAFYRNNDNSVLGVQPQDIFQFTRGRCDYLTFDNFGQALAEYRATQQTEDFDTASFHNAKFNQDQGGWYQYFNDSIRSNMCIVKNEHPSERHGGFFPSPEFLDKYNNNIRSEITTHDNRINTLFTREPLQTGNSAVATMTQRIDINNIQGFVNGTVCGVDRVVGNLFAYVGAGIDSYKYKVVYESIYKSIPEDVVAFNNAAGVYESVKSYVLRARRAPVLKQRSEWLEAKGLVGSFRQPNQTNQLTTEESLKAFEQAELIWPSSDISLGNLYYNTLSIMTGTALDRGVFAEKDDSVLNYTNLQIRTTTGSADFNFEQETIPTELINLVKNRSEATLGLNYDYNRVIILSASISRSLLVKNFQGEFTYTPPTWKYPILQKLYEESYANQDSDPKVTNPSSSFTGAFARLYHTLLMTQNINKADVSTKEFERLNQGNTGNTGPGSTSPAPTSLALFRPIITSDIYLDQLANDTYTYTDYLYSEYQALNQYKNVPIESKLASPSLYYHHRLHTSIGSTMGRANEVLLPPPTASNTTYLMPWELQKQRLKDGLTTRFNDAEDFIFKYIVKPVSDFLGITDIATTTNFDTPKSTVLRELIHVVATEYPENKPFAILPKAKPFTVPEDTGDYNVTGRVIENGEILEIADYKNQYDIGTTLSDLTGVKLVTALYQEKVYYVICTPDPTPGTPTPIANIVGAPVIASRTPKVIEGMVKGSDLMAQVQANQFWQREGLLPTTQQITSDLAYKQDIDNADTSAIDEITGNLLEIVSYKAYTPDVTINDGVGEYGQDQTYGVSVYGKKWSLYMRKVLAHHFYRINGGKYKPDDKATVLIPAAPDQELNTLMLSANQLIVQNNVEPEKFNFYDPRIVMDKPIGGTSNKVLRIELIPKCTDTVQIQVSYYDRFDEFLSDQLINGPTAEDVFAIKEKMLLPHTIANLLQKTCVLPETEIPVTYNGITVVNVGRDSVSSPVYNIVDKYYFPSFKENYLKTVDRTTIEEVYATVIESGSVRTDEQQKAFDKVRWLKVDPGAAAMFGIQEKLFLPKDTATIEIKVLFKNNSLAREESFAGGDIPYDSDNIPAEHTTYPYKLYEAGNPRTGICHIKLCLYDNEFKRTKKYPQYYIPKYHIWSLMKDTMQQYGPMGYLFNKKTIGNIQYTNPVFNNGFKYRIPTLEEIQEAIKLDETTQTYATGDLDRDSIYNKPERSLGRSTIDDRLGRSNVQSNKKGTGSDSTDNKSSKANVPSTGTYTTTRQPNRPKELGL